MGTTRRKKMTAPLELEEGAVQVRVSSRAPRGGGDVSPRGDVSPKRLYATRAQNLATALLEGVIGQLADYIENSHAVEKLIRAQTRQVLRELARDPQLTALIRSQTEQYIAELVAHPEILEPLVRTQVDRYLDNLLRDSVRMQAVAEKIKQGEPSPPAPRKRIAHTSKIKLD